MFRPWQLAIVLLLTGVAFAASVSLALLADARGPATPRSQRSQNAEGLPDRTNCDEVYGTAYRSENERAWFSENCSAWSRAVGDLPLASSLPEAALRDAAPGPGPAGRDCAQVRGRPYASNEERTWYLANCQGTRQQAQASTGPDRTDCNQVRGTPYRSDNERRWYQQHCLAR
jgi:hypothetical protein